MLIELSRHCWRRLATHAHTPPPPGIPQLHVSKDKHSLTAGMEGKLHCDHMRTCGPERCLRELDLSLETRAVEKRRHASIPSLILYAAKAFE